MAKEIRQAGAEIEITPAMIEAGAAVFLRCYDQPVAINETDRAMARDFISAVAEASAGQMRLNLSQVS